MELSQLMQIEPTVKRRHGLIRKLVDDREMKNMNMKVKDVEFVGALADLLQHHDVMRERIMNLWIKPQADLGARHEFGAGLRITGREKRHIVPEIDEFFG